MSMSKAAVRWLSFGLLASRRLCAASYSVGVAVTEPEAISKTKPLFRRLFALGGTPGVSVAETMEEWKSEGRRVKGAELVRYVLEFRRYRNKRMALELTDWMVEASGIKLTPSIHAIRLDLLAKSKGVEEAEKYFANLPETSRKKRTYEALLSAYCQGKMLDKALALHDKMRELNITCDSFTYNNLMTLHMKLGHPEKIPSLFQEMKAANVSPDDVTHSILMKSYSEMNDIDSIEAFVTESEKDAQGPLSWYVYSNMASRFIEARLFEKAEPALVKLEAVMDSQDRECYHHLISMYACVGNSAGVIRVWKSLKDSAKTNRTFLLMFQACIKLDEIDVLKQCYDEWNSIGLTFDVKLPYVVMAAYIRKDMFKEVDHVLDNVIERGRGNDCNFWRKFVGYLLTKREMDLALKSLKFAISCNKPQQWSPEKELVKEFLVCFEEEKDVERAEALYKILKDINGVDMDVYKSLLRTYLAAGRKDPAFRRRIEEDGFEPSSETEELLERVCL